MYIYIHNKKTYILFFSLSSTSILSTFLCLLLLSSSSSSSFCSSSSSLSLSLSLSSSLHWGVVEVESAETPKIQTVEKNKLYNAKRIVTSCCSLSLMHFSRGGWGGGRGAAINVIPSHCSPPIPNPNLLSSSVTWRVS